MLWMLGFRYRLLSWHQLIAHGAGDGRELLLIALLAALANMLTPLATGLADGVCRPVWSGGGSKKYGSTI